MAQAKKTTGTKTFRRTAALAPTEHLAAAESASPVEGAPMDPESLRWFEAGLRRLPLAELESMFRGYARFSRDPGTVAAIRTELERRKRRKRGKV